MIPVAVVVGGPIAKAFIGPAGDQSPAQRLPLMKGAASLPCQGRQAAAAGFGRVVRPYKDFYKIHSMHTRPGRCK